MMWTVWKLQENVKTWEILVYYINMKIEGFSAVMSKMNFCGKQKNKFYESLLQGTEKWMDFWEVRRVAACLKI